MKTTMPLRQFVTEPVEDKLRAKLPAGDKPWLKLARRLRHLRKESARIRRVA